MTLGTHPELLVLGYLRNQRLCPCLESVYSVQVDWETESCAVTTFDGVSDLEAKLKHRPSPAAAARVRCSGASATGWIACGCPPCDCASPASTAARCAECPQRGLSAPRCTDVPVLALRAGSVRPGSGRWRRSHAAHRALRRGRGPAQRRRRHLRAHVAERHRRRRQGLLHHRPADLRDGHQGGADGHPRAAVALRRHPPRAGARAQDRRHV
jgi:hypothetical protein